MVLFITWFAPGAEEFREEHPSPIHFSGPLEINSGDIGIGSGIGSYGSDASYTISGTSGEGVMSGGAANTIPGLSTPYNSEGSQNVNLTNNISFNVNNTPNYLLGGFSNLLNNNNISLNTLTEFIFNAASDSTTMRAMIFSTFGGLPFSDLSQTDISDSNPNKYCDFDAIVRILCAQYLIDTGFVVSKDVIIQAAKKLIFMNVIDNNGEYKTNQGGIDYNAFRKDDKGNSTNIVEGRYEVADYIWNVVLGQSGKWDFEQISGDQADQYTIIQSPYITQYRDINHFFNFLYFDNNNNFVVYDTYSNSNYYGALRIQTIPYSSNSDNNPGMFDFTKIDWNYSFTRMVLKN